MNVIEIHARFANTILLFCLIMAVWGAWRFLRVQGIAASYWGALVIAEALILAQVGIGVYIWVLGLRPVEGIHLLYGFVIALPIPFVYLYTRGRDGRPEILLYTVAFLVLLGLTVRAITTGGG